MLLLLDYNIIPKPFSIEISSQEQTWYNAKKPIIPQH